MSIPPPPFEPDAEVPELDPVAVDDDDCSARPSMPSSSPTASGESGWRRCSADAEALRAILDEDTWRIFSSYDELATAGLAIRCFSSHGGRLERAGGIL